MKKAFTMIELVFVLVVIGILAATIIPRVQTNPLQEAGVQLVSHIRYTQHLALIDDKYDAGDANWFKKRWQIVFGNSAAEAGGVPAYTIFSDTAGSSTGNVNPTEVARNPENSIQYMTGGYSGSSLLDIRDTAFNGMKKLNLGMSYGVTSITLDGGCANGRISFDHFGRPMEGDQHTMTGSYLAPTQRLIVADCNVTLAHSNGNSLIITIRPETGYTDITQYQ